MPQLYSLVYLLLLLVFLTQPILGDTRQPLQYRPPPVDNPLKGLVPYQADARHKFPHTLEFNYLPYADLVRGYDKFDWEPLEQMLDDIASRGHQAVLRIYLEYPDKTDGIPQFLIRDGLKIHKYQNTNTQPLPPARVETPDYEDQNLRRSLISFLAAFGKKYDGDPRIGFITAGLLGTWGEWHTHPREELFASQQVQQEVMDAYEAAFRVTPVLLRYPVGAGNQQKASNADRKFGYHDDSFAWATLETGKKGDEWFFMTTLKAAGPAAQAKWRTHPIGGEIRPEAWGQVFDKNPGKPEIQDFRKCVEETHTTWLLDSGMFRGDPPADRILRAEAEVRLMGYEFYAPAVTSGAVQDGKFVVKLEIENRGVAPFYYDWQPEYGMLADKKAVRTFVGSGKLTGLLPGDKPRVWNDMLDVMGIPAGEYTLAVRVPNPLKGGQPVRFANTTQDADVPGWLSLGVVRIR